MANIHERLKEVRLARGYTLAQLAELLGVKEATVQRYESGEIKNIKHETVSMLSDILKCSPQYLMGWTDEQFNNSNISNESVKAFRIPVYGKVAAGIPLSAIEDIIDYEEIDEKTASQGEYIALQIKGSSMEPKISNGDVVIVRLQSDFENGDTVIVLVNGDEATCKKIRKTPEGVMLISTNPSYEPMFYSRKQVESLPIRVLGKVVELRAKF